MNYLHHTKEEHSHLILNTVQLFMLFPAAGVVKSLSANVTEVRRLSRVRPDVDRQISIQRKRFAAILAGVRAFAAVRPHVVHQLARLRKPPVAHLANVRFLTGVNLAVRL